jgi:hypothetical protein
MVGGLSVKPNKGDAVLFWSMVCFLNVFLFFYYYYFFISLFP